MEELPSTQGQFDVLYVLPDFQEPSVGGLLRHVNVRGLVDDQIVQRRGFDGLEREDFNRTWKEYAKGFGNLNGDYWLGEGRFLKIWVFLNGILT